MKTKLVAITQPEHSARTTGKQATLPAAICTVQAPGHHPDNPATCGWAGVPAVRRGDCFGGAGRCRG